MYEEGPVGMIPRANSTVSVFVLLFFLLAAVTGCWNSEEARVTTTGAGSLASAMSRVCKEAGRFVTVAAGGDVNLGDGVAPYLTAQGVDYPWVDVAGMLSSADVAFVNLECCIASSGRPVPGKEFTFRGPADSAPALARAGVDVVSVANNHSKDYGTQAFVETLRHLEDSGVAWCGGGLNEKEAYSPAVIEAHGATVAFLAFTGVVPDGWPAVGDTPGCATTWDRGRIAGVIRDADAKYDYVVVSYHWGIELMTSPDGTQKSLAHLAVDSGSDLVLGHHPHVVQGFEVYKERLIAYSLGNFIFSPPREISSRTVGVIAMLGPGGLIRAHVAPLAIRSCRPLLMQGERADSWMRTVKDYSEALGTEMKVSKGRGYIERAK